MPRTPVIQHQKTAPGPPRATAVERPIMLPVPRVAAKVVAKDANEPRPLAADVSFLTDNFRATGIFFCINPVRKVKKMWVNRRKISSGPFQKTPFMVCSSEKMADMWITTSEITIFL